ncbi:MAG TPA: LptA/OstA family protein [Vicinamibacterales bacterium]|nr:LptA/OstA family protein [Vicinamibacterales bacterium]
MKWQKVARVVVALIGVGCAVAVYVVLRKKPVAAPPAPAPATLLDSTVTATSTKGTQKVVDSTTGEVNYEIDFERARIMADGRKVFEEVRFRFGHNGVPYTVNAGVAELAGKSGPTGDQPSTVVFRRKVRMTGENGFEVSGDEATYLNEEKRTNFPGPVSFKRDRMTGEGVGGDLYMDRSVFWMYDQSRLTIAPEGSGPSVVVTAKRIGLAEADRYIRAEEGTQLTRDNQHFSADAMVVRFGENTQSVNRIELEGKSVVRQTGTGDRPDMRGDRIFMDFAPETSLLAHAQIGGSAVLTMRENNSTTRVSGSDIEFYVGADGEVLTRLSTTAPTEVLLPRDGETPARTIQSAELLAEGPDPKGLDRAVFSGGVQYRETLPASRGQAAAIRVATSNSLVLGLEGALNQVTVADFRQNFCFVGPMAPTPSTAVVRCSAAKMPAFVGNRETSVVAAGDQGLYDAKLETLQLRPGVQKSQSKVVNQQIDVTATEIDLDIKQDAFKARGKVESTIESQAATTEKNPKASGLFDKGRPISGVASELAYSEVTGVAVYTGDVVLVQRGEGNAAANVIRGDQVRLDERKQDIEANGNARAELLIEQAPGARDAKVPGRTVLTGDRMTFVDATRRVVFSGDATMDTIEAGVAQRLTAERITLDMMAERRALKNLEAVAADKGEVRATLPEGRVTIGTRLTYDAETDRYVVTGAQALFVSRSATKGPGICEVGTGTELSFLRTEGYSNVKNKGGSLGTARERKCAEVIK